MTWVEDYVWSLQHISHPTWMVMLLTALAVFATAGWATRNMSGPEVFRYCVLPVLFGAPLSIYAAGVVGGPSLAAVNTVQFGLFSVMSLCLVLMTYTDSRLPPKQR